MNMIFSIWFLLFLRLTIIDSISAVKNEVDGIGLSRSNNTRVYGSNGRLQGINVFPIDTFFDMADTGAVHETGHQWINFLTLPILRSGSPHWPVSSLARGIMGFNIPGSIVGGNFPFNLVPLPNGDYRLEQTAAAARIHRPGSLPDGPVACQ